MTWFPLKVKDVQQLLASALPRRIATGVSPGGLGQQGNSDAAAVINR